MKTFLKKLVYFFIITLIAGCDNESYISDDGKQLSIIPQPVKMQLNSGEFELINSSVIVLPGEELVPLAEYLADEINTATGLQLQIIEGNGKGISLVLQDDLLNTLGAEG